MSQFVFPFKAPEITSRGLELTHKFMQSSRQSLLDAGYPEQELDNMSVVDRFHISMNLWLQEKLSLAEQAVRENPQDVNALFDLGTTLISLGRLEEGIAVLQQIVEISPGHQKVLGHLGLALWELYRFEEAAIIWKKHLAILPDNAVLWHNLGLALEALGQTDEAEAAFKRAQELDPKQFLR